MINIEDLRIGQKIYAEVNRGLEEFVIFAIIVGYYRKYVEASSSFDGKEVSLNLNGFSLTPPKKKKRYWIWDVEDKHGYILKSPYYFDENGKAPNKISFVYKDIKHLNKKHENEFIDVEEE